MIITGKLLAPYLAHVATRANSKDTSVEETVGLEGSIDAKLGGAKLAYEVKTGDTLGFEIEFGETDYMCKATLPTPFIYQKCRARKTVTRSLLRFSDTNYATLHLLMFWAIFILISTNGI